ncbi:L-threonine aldolase [Natronincola peptidivorans]|uniref:L-threonine aldolase n=1 Tax=Natronincola peptidivorans TaxID=426128 RepID=A0A1H9YUQ9_9FIRM|nr:low-specificity L-threonine aldolase [Natronincola peptidivorans]SES72877.1 L-threonine aldolase [Natronincola peptidivorans]
MKKLDFRSDTVTMPTAKMLERMVQAELGDDVYGDDSTVNKLEALAAELLGKEAGLFVPTGTMGNLLAIMSHTTPGQEIILEENCHIYLYEVAGIARVAGVQAKPIKGIDGVMSPKDLENAIRKENIHFPETGLICLENTHNMAGGMVVPLENMESIYALAKHKNIPLHLDGARIFNASRYLNKDVKEIARFTDSVMFCFSKGLGSPIGSMLVGTKDFIKKARKLRKMLGGGMRQVGVIAAAGILALEEMPKVLDIDHTNAKLLAKGLNKLAGINIDIEKIHTNIVNVDFSNTGLSTNQLIPKLQERGLLSNPRNNDVIRFVTHKDVSSDDVKEAIEMIKETINQG